jgi:small subunit ribosomal protein S16
LYFWASCFRLTTKEENMSVKLRLTRTGSKKRPFYRVVAINSAARRDGRPLEFLGYYNPMTSPATVEINMEKAKKWLDMGAEASDTVRSLLKAGK